MPCKPLDAKRHTFQYLSETISTQLVGQYMKAAKSKHGILLLCLLEHRNWKIHGKQSTFADLIASLREEADGVRRANANVDGLIVIGVDMSAWKAQKVARNGTAKSKSSKDRRKVAKKPARRRLPAVKKVAQRPAPKR